jgi:malate dehydrogenase (oxaloacetate-decarboxylating)(NADP+)
MNGSHENLRRKTMTSDKRGIELLQDPSLNKSTAFTEAEKQALGIVGLMPDLTETEDLQLKRVMMQLGHKTTDLDRYIYLVNLLDHNETLFYRTVMSDPVRFLPIVYDPTIGEACLKFGHIYRQARGMYLSMSRRGKVKEILRNWPQQDVRIICVTDGGRILGLGDLGANGAGIPIGKLQLYTACAGVPPQYLLPMYLDAGTNNEQYLHDPLYLGMRKTRPSTDELFSFVDEFVEAVQEVFPKCCIHFEDWTGADAVHLLQRYRDKYCVYNDDVQGTAGITLAGMINATKLKGTKLKDEKYLFLGAGSAGIGLANLLCSALVEQGMPLKDAQSRVNLFDVNGLLESSRKDLVDFQKPYAHQRAPTRDFVAAIESIKPTTIIGVSTIGGAFTQKVIESMSRLNDRPVILALSNPTEKAECTPEQAYTWSKGKAIYAAGVQFAPVHYNGQTFLPGRPTTSTSSRQSGWRSSQRRQNALPTRCSSKRDRQWRIRCRPSCSSRVFCTRCSRTFSRPRSKRRRGWRSWSSIRDLPASNARLTWSRSSVAMSTSRNTHQLRTRQRKRPKSESTFNSTHDGDPHRSV